MKPTVTRRRPPACSASMMRSAAAAVGVSGFSQKTGLPAPIAARTSTSCAGPKLQIMTASTSSDAMSDAESAYAVPPIRSATSLARTSSTSATATTRPPAMTVWMRSMWACPMPPGPIIPMRTVMCVTPSSLEAEADGREVLAGPDGVRQRVGRVAGVHVLLAHDVELLVEVGQGLDERRHVGCASRRRDRAPLGDGETEGPVLVVSLLDEALVHRLDVDVGDALGVLAAQLHRVAAAVHDVARVEAEADVVGVGRLEDAVDVLRRLDVAVAVRVEHHLEAVVLLHDATQLVGVADVGVPGLGRQHSVVGVVPRLLVAEHRGQVHDVLRPDGSVRLGDLAKRLLRVGPRLRLVEDAPAGAGDDPEAALVHLLLEPLRVLGEVAERPRLHHGEAGLGHLVEGGLPVDLLVVLGKPDAPLVGTDADGQLAVALVGVAGPGLGHRWSFLSKGLGVSRSGGSRG